MTLVRKAKEKNLERRTCDYVKGEGGLAIKLVAVGLTGLPDRLFLMPGGRICFAEFKSHGKALEVRQTVMKKLIIGLGFRVYKIDSEDALTEFKMVA